MEREPLEENATEPSQQPDNEQPIQPEEKSETEILIEKIAELEKQTATLKDQLLRRAAEFDNYKKRTESETLNFMKFAGENIITQLLPILDDITRFLKSGKETAADDPFYKGIELIHAKFFKLLEAQGLKPIESIGKEFNVDFHDALMQVPNPSVPPHTITDEVEKGYMLFDKVIRHAKVIVSSPAEEGQKN